MVDLTSADSGHIEVVEAKRPAADPEKSQTPDQSRPSQTKEIGEDTWRRFTPKKIDRSLCMARVWKGASGLGSQCSKQAPDGSDLCLQHAKPYGLIHGRVDGDIPPEKLEKFLQ